MSLHFKKVILDNVQYLNNYLHTFTIFCIIYYQNIKNKQEFVCTFHRIIEINVRY